MKSHSSERQKMAANMLDEALKRPGVADVMEVQSEWVRIETYLPQFGAQSQFYTITSATSTEPLVSK